MIPLINECAFQMFVYPGRGFITGNRTPLSPQQETIYALMKAENSIEDICKELNITRQSLHAHIQTMVVKGWADCQTHSGWVKAR